MGVVYYLFDLANCSIKKFKKHASPEGEEHCRGHMLSKWGEPVTIWTYGLALTRGSSLYMINWLMSREDTGLAKKGEHSVA